MKISSRKSKQKISIFRKSKFLFTYIKYCKSNENTSDNPDTFLESIKNPFVATVSKSRIYSTSFTIATATSLWYFICPPSWSIRSTTLKLKQYFSIGLYITFRIIKIVEDVRTYCRCPRNEKWYVKRTPFPHKLPYQSKINKANL